MKRKNMTDTEKYTGAWYATASDQERDIFKSWIKSHLAMGEMKIKFTKKDNTIRDMRCTLGAGYLPVTEEKEIKRKENTEVLAVWDMDKNAWRAIRYETIKEIRFDI
jgi:hypothetical protein